MVSLYVIVMQRALQTGAVGSRNRSFRTRRKPQGKATAKSNVDAEERWRFMWTSCVIWFLRAARLQENQINWRYWGWLWRIWSRCRVRLTLWPSVHSLSPLYLLSPATSHNPTLSPPPNFTKAEIQICAWRLIPLQPVTTSKMSAKPHFRLFTFNCPLSCTLFFCHTC